MNIKLKKTALTATSSLIIGAMFQSTALAADGQISFTGKVTAASCTVATASKSFSVALPSITAAAIGSTAGDMAGETAFSITLEGCVSQTATPEKVRIAFVGTPDSGNATALKNTAATGAATGVGLQLLREDAVTKIDINNGTNKDKEYAIPASGSTAATIALNYHVAYVNTSGSAPTTGDVTATTTFSVEYN